MKKQIISIILLLSLIISFCGITYAGEITVEDVVNAMSDSRPDNDTLNTIMQMQTEDGDSVENITDSELIYRIFQIKNDGQRGKKLFENYSGDFSEEIDFEVREWLVPVLENGEIVGEYNTYGNAKTGLLSYNPLKNGTSVTMVYPTEKLAQMISENTSGELIDIKSICIVSPAVAFFLYIKTNDDEYILPTRDVNLYFYNENNEREKETSFEKLIFYSADEFVEKYQIAVEDYEKYQEELSKNTSASGIMVDNGGREFIIDENGNKVYLDDIEVTPSPTATAAPTSTPKPTETTKPTAEPTAEPSAKPTTEPTTAPTEAPKKTISVTTTNGEIEVTAEDKRVEFTDVKPFVDEANRTQMPIRVLAEMLGFDVDWNDTTKTATLENNENTITVKIGENTINKNNKTIAMDTTARVINDRTYIPLRAISEALGYVVEWK